MKWFGKYNVKSMIKNSSTIKDKQVAFWEQATIKKLKHAIWLKRDTTAVIHEYKSTVRYAVLFGLMFRIFTGKRKAFAKYAAINMQYPGANTNSYFLLQNNPSKSRWKQRLFMFENNTIKTGQYTILLRIHMNA